MSDFITMSCPSCGGKLSISPNTSTLVCQNCGTEHMIRREAGSVLLESFAKCPQCSRNDKVQKVSAILASQTGTVHGVMSMQVEASTLAVRLSPPLEPAFISGLPPTLAHKEVDVTYNVLASSIIGLFGLFMFGGGILSLFSAEKNLFLSICAALPGISLIALAIYTARNTILEPFRKKQRIEEHDREMDNWKKLIQNREMAERIWSNDMQTWNQLYYCARDDCLFILGESKFAPSSHMMEYIHWLQNHSKSK